MRFLSPCPPSTESRVLLENPTQTLPFPGQRCRSDSGFSATVSVQLCWGGGGAFSAGETPVLTWWGTTCPETSFSPVALGGRVSPSPKAVPQTGRKNSSRVLMEVLPGFKFRRELNYYKSKPSSLSVLGNHHFFHFQGLHFSSVLHAYPSYFSLFHSILLF